MDLVLPLLPAKLNIPQLTLGELAELDRHGTGNTKVLV